MIQQTIDSYICCPVQDLSARFSDGRLSTQKLLAANDDELAQMLIEVRGIGRVSSFISHWLKRRVTISSMPVDR
jgi:DNA-3-methyladenine glycosylase II